MIPKRACQVFLPSSVVHVALYSFSKKFLVWQPLPIRTTMMMGPHKSLSLTATESPPPLTLHNLLPLQYSQTSHLPLSSHPRTAKCIYKTVRKSSPVVKLFLIEYLPIRDCLCFFLLLLYASLSFLMPLSFCSKKVYESHAAS